MLFGFLLVLESAGKLFLKTIKMKCFQNRPFFQKFHKKFFANKIAAYFLYLEETGGR